jgi:uncharacterized YigZ family protein
LKKTTTIPSTRRHRTEITIKGSRFITTIGHTESVDDAKRFIEAVKAEFADATHNCWGFVAGGTQTAPATGMNDDGEPRGTAGRPILNVLEHSGICEITAVVTRYFGGTKLGRGGLVRAYSRSVSEALETLPLEDKVAMVSLSVTVDYSAAENVKNICITAGGKMVNARYAADVSLRLEIPAASREEVVEQIAGITAGKAEIR